MIDFKREVVSKVYDREFTPEQAAHISDLDVQIIWNTSHEDFYTLENQLLRITGVRVDYDRHNMHHGMTIQLNTVDDTDEAWEQINKTIETFLATPLAIEPAEEV